MEERISSQGKDKKFHSFVIGNLCRLRVCFILVNFASHFGLLLVRLILFTRLRCSKRLFIMVSPIRERLSPNFPVLVTKRRDNYYFNIFHPQTRVASHLSFPHYQRAIIEGYSYDGWLLISSDEDNNTRQLINYNLNTGIFHLLQLLELEENNDELFSDPHSLTLFVNLHKDRTLHIYSHRFGGCVGWGDSVTNCWADPICGLICDFAFRNSNVIWFDSDKEIHSYSLDDNQYRHAPFTDGMDVSFFFFFPASILFHNAAMYLLVIGFGWSKIYSLPRGLHP